jgi:zinc protease
MMLPSRALRCVALFSVLLLATVVRAQPLPTDPTLISGELENGLRYIVKQHNNPPARAAVWMHVHTGSFNETDPQRGIAHFLEHMAFNGSEHFPPGSVIPFFQSLGLAFGQHQNAFTSFDQTTYSLELPDNKPETLDKALGFFADVSFRLSLLTAEIDKEREIILEERRTRLGGQQRIRDYYFERLAPGSLLGQRLPIGTEETIKAVQEQDFRDYYSKWYAPANTTLIVVADADPAAVIEQIKKHFAAAPKREKAAPQDIGIKPYTEIGAIVASDPEIADATIGIVWLTPPRPPTTTEELYREDLLDHLATWIFNRRIYNLVVQGKADFRSGGSSVASLFNAGAIATAAVSGSPEKWKTMLEQLAVEVQRAKLHGFTEQELGDARKELTAGAERQLEVEPTIPATQILSEINDAITSGEPVMSARQELDLITKLLPTIKLEEVSARFASHFDTTKPMMFTLMTKTEGAPAEAEVIEAGRAAVQAQPQQEAARARASTLLATEPTPGNFAEWAQEEGSDVWSGWLENGIRAHYRFMDYRKDQVLVGVTLAGAEILESPETRGLTQAGGLALGRPATSELSSTDITDLLTGLKVQAGGQVGTDTAMVSILGKPDELVPGFQLAYLLLTDPLVEAPALDQWKQRQIQGLALRKLEPNRVFADLIVDTVYPKDEPRVDPLTEEQINRITPESATAWIQKLVRESPAEVVLVGDLPRERAEELIRTYFGSLPKRDRIALDTNANLRKLTRPQGPLSESRKIPTKTDKALAVSGFYAADQTNLRDVRLLHLASRVLNTRATEHIREEKQLAYSPSVANRPGAEFPGFGMFTTRSDTAPDKLGEFTEAVRQMYDAFAKDGPTEEELEVAKKQFANMLDENMREPTFWAGALSAMTYRGGSIADTLSAPAQYQAFTAEEVRDAFARYYKPESTFVVTVAPDPTVPPQGFVIDPKKLDKPPEQFQPPAPQPAPAPK